MSTFGAEYIVATSRKMIKQFKTFITEIHVRLQYHDTLNDSLWNDDVLKPEIRTALLKFADTYAKFSGVEDSQIKDVVMTGGNANFNYTPISDIDVHIVVDRNALGSNRMFLDNYLQSKKMVWTMSHNIRIHGYPVEPYIQDVAELYHEGQGVYSLKRGEWIQKPIHGLYDFEHDKDLKRKVLFYAHLVDSMIKSHASLESFDRLKKKFAEMRSAGIQKAGEFSVENNTFKSLRNRGILDAMNKYLRDAKDSELSVQ